MRQPAASRALTFLIATALVAGCLGRGDSPAADADDGATPSTPDGGREGAESPPTADGLRPLAFGEPVAPTILWLNGSFQFQQNGFPLGRATQGALMGDNPRATDIGGDVPKGVPVVLVAEVNADLGEGDVDLWFNLPDDEIWASDFDTPYGGYSRIELVVVHDSSEPVEVVVRYDEFDDGTDFEYSLFVEIAPVSDTIPGGLPFAVPLVPNANLTLGRTDTAADTVLLAWSPTDEFLGRFPVADGAPTFAAVEDGEHVFLIAEGGSAARVGVTGGADDATPRVLTQVIELGEPHALGSEPATWTFDAPTAPLQAGLFIEIPGATPGYRLSLASPAGTLFSGDVSDEVPFFMSGHNWGTNMGHENLVPGTYAASVEVDAAHDASASHYVVYFGR